jgi:hypothetical protein
MESYDVAPKPADETESGARLVIVDLGKKRRRAIKNLKRGTGNAMSEVEEAIDRARARLPEADKHKPVVSVVLIYERKRRRLSAPSLPFSPLNLFR